MVYGSHDVFSPKDEPWGVVTISEFIWGNIIAPKNSPHVNRQFQAKRVKYENRDILINVRF